MGDDRPICKSVARCSRVELKGVLCDSRSRSRSLAVHAPTRSGDVPVELGRRRAMTSCSTARSLRGARLCCSIQGEPPATGTPSESARSPQNSPCSTFPPTRGQPQIRAFPRISTPRDQCQPLTCGPSTPARAIAAVLSVQARDSRQRNFSYGMNVVRRSLLMPRDRRDAVR